MKIPPGKTEAEVLAAIDKVVNILAPTFVFGYFDVEDLKQEGRFFALEVLEKERYDPSRPLENFLYTHIRNQFINLQRKLQRRNDPPCAACHRGDICGPDGRRCDKYESWYRRNQSKANLLKPLDITNISDANERRSRCESSSESDVEVAEMLALVDEKLPVELRATYNQMRDGVKVPKGRRVQVENAVREILRGSLNV